MTGHNVDFLPASDAMLRHAPLDYVSELPVLGINVRFATNSRAVLATVGDAFGGWENLDPRYRDGTIGLRVNLIVHDGDEPGGVRIKHYLPDDTRFVVHSSGSVGVSDPSRREAIAYVTTELVASGAPFRDTVVEALTYALLAAFDRHPIHASGIAYDNHAILLAGPSGSGKSTLAHAAHAEGIRVLSDDRVWIQLEPALRVWGNPGHVRLLPPGASKEAAKEVFSLDGPECYVAERATVCVLERGESVLLTRLDRADVVDALTRRVDPGFDRFPDRHGAVVSALAEGGGWRLMLSDDARDAVPQLRAMRRGSS